MTEAKPVSHWKPWKLSLGERRALLYFGDFVMAILALGVSIFWWDRSMRFIDLTFDFMQKRGYLWFYLLPLLWMFLLVDSYDPQRAANLRKTIRSIATSAVIGILIYAVIYFSYADSPETLLPRLGVAIFLGAAAGLTLLWRIGFIHIFTTPEFMRRVLLVGGGRSGQAFLDVVHRIKPSPYILVGIIDDDPEKANLVIGNLPVLGTSEALQSIIEEQKVTDLIVAITGEMRGGMFQALLDAQEQGVIITRMPVAYEQLVGRVPIQQLEADWILRSFVDHARLNGFYYFSKRVVDILGGLVGCVILLVLLPFIALTILMDDGRPVFYSQTRSGKGGQPYNILKFRTMRRDAEADGKPKWAKEDDERATRSGKILRKTHLDELPQFVNVLKGDMSLVGPRAERPELVNFFQQQVPFYRARLLVRPGITGWAQVNYGYVSTIEETTLKLEYDLYYILHCSLAMDLVILLRTPNMVIGFRGR